MRRVAMVPAAAIAVGMLISPAWAQVPKCAVDMTRPGSFCVDVYEASVWRIPATNPGGKSNASLVKKVQKGKATAADLAAGGATQLGIGVTDDYTPCTNNGQTSCGDVYAVSIAGVPPSANVTWFQAQQACANSQKRLPRSGEWQQAVAGTPDPGPDNGTTDCNTASAGVPVSTGSRSACVSRFGNFDMVGNVSEWVEDWVPLSTACPGWGPFSGDFMCLSGASTTVTVPGALRRGGSFDVGTIAGPLAVGGNGGPDNSDNAVGFRCAR